MWHVPISWVDLNSLDSTDSKEEATTTWLTGERMEVEVGEEELPLLNPLGQGYYRVNYDEATWVRIAEALRRNHTAIHPLQRMVLICDLLALHESGHVSEATKWGVLAYGEREEAFGPNLAFFLCSGAAGRSGKRGQDKQVVEASLHRTRELTLHLDRARSQH